MGETEAFIGVMVKLFFDDEVFGLSFTMVDPDLYFGPFEGDADLTAWFPEAGVKGSGEGVDDFLSKPLTPFNPDCMSGTRFDKHFYRRAGMPSIDENEI